MAIFVVLKGRGIYFAFIYSLCVAMLNSICNLFFIYSNDPGHKSLSHGNRKARINNRLYDFLKKSKDFCVFELDIKMNFFWITDSIYKMFGLVKTDLNTSYCKEIILSNIYKKNESVFNFINRENNQEKWFRINCIKEGNLIIGSIIDVTKEEKEKRNVEDIYKMDALTGLLSRRELDHVLDEAIGHTENGKYVAFYFIDIDFFKGINDTYGHSVGDDVLRRFGRALIIPDINSTYVRVAGDEFAIIISNIRSESDALEYGSRHIKNVRNTEFYAGKEKITVTFSCGCALYGKDTKNKSELMKFADNALYKAKQQGRNTIAMFDRKRYDRQIQQSRIMLNIDDVIKKRQFKILYQPIISVRTGSIAGYEPFLRMSQELGITVPEFIEAIKRANKFDEFNDTFMSMIKEDWHLNMYRNRFITVSQHIGVEKISKDSDGWDPVFSITELDEKKLDELISKVQILRNKGYDVLIDNYRSDFICNFIMLSSGIRLVKMDDIITNDIFMNKHKQILLRNIVQFVHQSGIKTIAKSIVNKEDMHVLINIGVDYLQGNYIIGKSPKIVNNIPEYIKKEILSASFSKNRPEIFP